MADDSKQTELKQTPIQMVRNKDFRVAFSNTFRFRASPNDIGITFGYATQVPAVGGGERNILQDEVEVVLTPTTLKLLKIALDDNVEAIEKAIGTIQLPQEMLEAIAEQKAKANEAVESGGSRQEVSNAETTIRRRV
jgi:hypothetical protein